MAEQRTEEPQNIEYRMSKEGILSIFVDSKDRAQRFHPSKFCGSIFEILRFASPWFCCFVDDNNLLEGAIYETL